MSTGVMAETRRVVGILQTVDAYQDECGQENYGDLTLADIDYLAQVVLDMDADELIAILRENF